jgi:hypothetical protein
LKSLSFLSGRWEVRSSYSFHYQILEIELNDETILRFDGDAYENYSTLKNSIYNYKYRGL